MSAPAAPPSRDAATYEEFYGFVQSPFTLAPDPRFFFPSESHDDALQLLLESLRRGDVVVVLTGAVGTGKTTLCRELVLELDETTLTSLVLNPFVSEEELLREILLDLGVLSREAVRSGRLAATGEELLATLKEFLASLASIGARALLIIDEAQNLSPHVLDRVHTLSKTDVNGTRMLQVVLAGQPRFIDQLAASEARQLDAEISVRAVLRPLTSGEVGPYVSHRLSVARGSSSVSFDPSAIALVHSISGGVPRVVNQVCDRALGLGVQSLASVISPEIVLEAAVGLDLELPTASRRWWERIPTWVPIAIAVLVLLSGIGLWLASLG